MPKKKRRPKFKKGPHKNFTDLKPLVNKYNAHTQGAREFARYISKVGETQTFWNLIWNGSEWVYVNFATTECSLDSRTSAFSRKMKTE